MDYLERYLNGEYQQVWEELDALGPEVRREPHYSAAKAVAAETMRRVQRNCALIVSRLEALGYQFGVYPDGSRGYVSIGPLTALDPDSESALEVLNQAAGPLPLSLEAFWREVGSVDFVGRMAGWPLGLDPLVVNPPEGALFDVEDGYPVDEAGRFDAGLAPDDLHKDNISGGGPYSVRLPEESADFPLLYERHELHFVPYLRMAILLWGGFPGLEEQDQPFVPLADLIGDLEAF